CCNLAGKRAYYVSLTIPKGHDRVALYSLLYNYEFHYFPFRALPLFGRLCTVPYSSVRKDCVCCVNLYEKMTKVLPWPRQRLVRRRGNYCFTWPSLALLSHRHPFLTSHTHSMWRASRINPLFL